MTETHNDHDLLIRLDEKVNTILTNQTNSTVEQGKFDARLRMLENFRYWILGGGAILGFVSGLVGKFILK